MEKNENGKSFGQKSTTQLAHVAVKPEDLEAVKHMLTKYATVKLGQTIGLSKHELTLVRKYFAGWTHEMVRDLYLTVEQLKGLEAEGLLKAPALQLQEVQQTLDQPLTTRQWSPSQFGHAVQGGSVVSEKPHFSPTIDAKTFELPRYWWLRPWSTVALLGGRLETLADQYNKDMKNVVGKLDASDRSLLKEFTRKDNSGAEISQYRLALETIAGYRPLTKNASHGRKMVELAEAMLEKFNR